ncbi:MAG: U32 family peptidase [Candidatus Weimeria sp.]
MIENRHLEVLAPAGDLKTLKTAILSGADAVYFGGEMFGARAYAHNFSYEDAEAGISFAHARGRRTYLTVNTLLKSLEIEKKVYDYLKAYYESGIDAVLVQDIGLMQLIRAYFPELRLHISTQVNVTSEYGAEFFKKLGARRIVLARELSLAEIRKIHDSCDIELECFAHGALCMSYSGQCLMSSMIGGRSGNRGRCAQPCRKCYELKGSSKKLSGRYPLSLKDLCTIEDVKALYEAGASSLKIEGRMKSPEYVAAVASTYRWAADIAESGEDFDKKELSEKRKALISAGTRGGSTDSYLHSHNDSSMISLKDSAFKTNAALALPLSEEKINARAKLTARVGEPLRIEIEESRPEGAVSEAESEKVSVSGPVVDKAKKPRDIKACLSEKISRTGDDRILIDQVSFDMDPDAFVPASVVKDLRRRAVCEFLGGLTIERDEPLPFEPLTESQMTEKARKSLKQILITCVSEEQLNEASRFKPDGFSVIIAVNFELYKRLDASRIKGRDFYLCLPDILRFDKNFSIDDDEVKSLFSGLVVSSFDEIEYVRKRLAEMPFITEQRVYSWSDRSRRQIMSLGAEFISAPVELNEKELSHLDNSSSFITVYGRTPLMYTAACQHKNADGCDKKQTCVFLKDERGAEFPVINYCSFCTNVVYNSLPTSLLPYCSHIAKMGAAGVRFDFTLETGKEVKNILNTFMRNAMEGRNEDVTAEVTRGHFHRGAE